MSEVNADGILLNPHEELLQQVRGLTGVLEAGTPESEQEEHQTTAYAGNGEEAGAAGGVPHVPAGWEDSVSEPLYSSRKKPERKTAAAADSRRKESRKKPDAPLWQTLLTSLKRLSQLSKATQKVSNTVSTRIQLKNSATL